MFDVEPSRPMDLSTRCPQCNKKHVYFSHEVGTEAQCRGCGETLSLRPQKTVETVRITVAVIVVLFIVFGVMLRFSRVGKRLFAPAPTAARHSPAYFPGAAEPDE